MFSDNLFAAANDDAIGIGADLHRASCHRREHRVAVAVEADQAGAGHGMLTLIEAVERSQHRLQRRSFYLQHLRHGQLALFRMGLPFRPAPTLSGMKAVTPSPASLRRSIFQRVA